MSDVVNLAEWAWRRAVTRYNDAAMRRSDDLPAIIEHLAERTRIAVWAGVLTPTHQGQLSAVVGRGEAIQLNEGVQ